MGAKGKSNLTFEERKKIEECLKNKLNFKQIGDSLNRASSTIIKEINNGGGYLKYTAATAEENYQHRLFERNDKISKKNKERLGKARNLQFSFNLESPKKIEENPKHINDDFNLKNEEQKEEETSITTKLINLSLQIDIIIKFLRSLDEKINKKL
jgi:hypothetical protein